MSLSSMPRVVLETASLLMVALSVATAAVTGYAMGTQAFQPWRWIIGGHDSGALLFAFINIAVALIKCSIPILWTRRQYTGRKAAVAFLVWAGFSIYLCTAFLGFGIGLVVRMDASGREVALFVGLWLVIEVTTGLLPAIASPHQAATERVTVTNEPLELREEPVATLPLPAIDARPPRRDLLGLLRRLAAGAAEHGVRVAPDGCLVTTQRRLAALAGMAPSQAHDELYRLKEDGAIDLTTSARQTVIRLRS